MRRAPRAALALLGACLLATPARADRVRVELVGLDGELRDNALAFMTLDDEGDDIAEGRIRRLALEAEDEIRLGLQPFGYYRPEIVSTLAREGDVWMARFQVSRGPVLRATRVDVEVSGEGAEDPAFRRMVREFPLAPGDPLRQPAYETAKQEMTLYATDHGYLDATFTAREIRIDLASYTSEIVLHLDTGPQYRFGPVTFEQQALDDDVLRGYVTFDQGDPFDTTELLKMQAALADSPYFQRVEVLPERDEAEGLEVPIRVALVPSRRQKWVVGAGYATDTGPRGTFQLEVRRINRRGHRAEIDAALSEVDNRAVASYLVPGPYPRTDVVRYSLGYSDLRSRSANAETFLAGIGRTESRGRWREALSLTYRIEEFEVGLDVGEAHLLVPEASWERTVADDRLYPRKGRRVSFLVRGGTEALLSDVDFVTALAEGKYVRALWRDVRLLARLQLGMTETDSFRDLPPSMRFFAGGDGSVRGYDFQELGELDAAGNVIGGDVLVTSTVELDWLFFEKLGRWGLAAFLDSGNAMDDFGDDLRHGVGGGIRWLSPVGLVKVDLAFPLDRDEDNFRLHLSLGPEL